MAPVGPTGPCRMLQRGLTSTALRELQPAAHLASDSSVPACATARAGSGGHPVSVLALALSPPHCTCLAPQKGGQGHTPWGPVLGGSPQCGYRGDQTHPRTETRTKPGTVKPHSPDGYLFPTLQSTAPAAPQTLGKRPFPLAPGAPGPHPILPCHPTAAEPCPICPHTQRPQGSSPAAASALAWDTHTHDQSPLHAKRGALAAGLGDTEATLSAWGHPAWSSASHCEQRAGRRGSGDA